MTAQHFAIKKIDEYVFEGIKVAMFYSSFLLSTVNFQSSQRWLREFSTSKEVLDTLQDQPLHFLTVNDMHWQGNRIKCISPDCDSFINTEYTLTLKVIQLNSVGAFMV